jgi:hypothetical protein
VVHSGSSRTRTSGGRSRREIGRVSRRKKDSAERLQKARGSNLHTRRSACCLGEGFYFAKEEVVKNGKTGVIPSVTGRRSVTFPESCLLYASGRTHMRGMVITACLVEPSCSDHVIVCVPLGGSHGRTRWPCMRRPPRPTSPFPVWLTTSDGTRYFLQARETRQWALGRGKRVFISRSAGLGNTAGSETVRSTGFSPARMCPIRKMMPFRESEDLR